MDKKQCLNDSQTHFEGKLKICAYYVRDSNHLQLVSQTFVRQWIISNLAFEKAGSLEQEKGTSTPIRE